MLPDYALGFSAYIELLDLELKGVEESNKEKGMENLKNMEPNDTRTPFIQRAVQPIWWKGSNRKLKYLLDELARLDMIDRDSPVNKLIKEHFIDKDKKPFTDSIAQNSSGMGSNKGTSKNSKAKPKGHQEIDSIIKSAKDLKD